MKRRDLMRKYSSSVAATMGLLLTGFVLVSPTVAQETVLPSTYSGRIGFIPPPDDAAPSQTRGGATRGECQATSLMPRSGTGLTTRERSSIYVHVAKNPGAKLNKAILSLKDDANPSEQYDAVIDLPEEALSRPGGILEVEFPESLPALEVGKAYSWTLIMICNELPIRPDSPTVGGGIKRVMPSSVVASSEGQSVVDRAIAYGEAGLWYDLLAVLTSAPSEAPEYDEFSGAWKKILTGEGVSEEVSEAIFIK